MALDFLSAFFLTNLVEMPAAYAILRRDERVLRVLAVVLLANVLTLPFVWFVFPAIVSGYYTALALSELFAFAAESAVYAAAFGNAPKARAIVAAISANFASMLVGLLL